jgi:hypothetical protein
MAISRYKGMHRPLDAQQLARGLGWFSIGLGVAELLAPRTVARGAGMNGGKGLLRMYGLREIATGVGILTAKNKAPWIWGRVGGDVLDLGTLATRRHANGGGRSALAMTAVIGVTAADLLCSELLAVQNQAPRLPMKDYSHRSGFRRPPNEMRGAARRNDMGRESSAGAAEQRASDGGQKPSVAPEAARMSQHQL